jgi:hypothetical protein
MKAEVANVPFVRVGVFAKLAVPKNCGEVRDANPEEERADATELAVARVPPAVRVGRLAKLAVPVN